MISSIICDHLDRKISCQKKFDRNFFSFFISFVVPLSKLHLAFFFGSLHPNPHPPYRQRLHWPYLFNTKVNSKSISRHLFIHCKALLNLHVEVVTSVRAKPQINVISDHHPSTAASILTAHCPKYLVHTTNQTPSSASNVQFLSLNTSIGWKLNHIYWPTLSSLQ